MFRGREQAHPERGRDLLNKLFEDLDGLATIESAPLQEGRNMSMLLGPSKEVDKLTADGQADEAPAAESPDSPAPAAETPDSPAETPDSPESSETSES
jgi:translation initiation factor IF-3